MQNNFSLIASPPPINCRRGWAAIPPAPSEGFQPPGSGLFSAQSEFFTPEAISQRVAQLEHVPAPSSRRSPSMGERWGCRRGSPCALGGLRGGHARALLTPISRRGLQEAQVTLAARLGEAEEKIKVLHAGRGGQAMVGGGRAPHPTAHPPLPLPSAEGHPDGAAGAAV